MNEKIKDSRQELVNRIMENMKNGYVLMPPEWNRTGIKNPYNPVSKVRYRAGNIFRLLVSATDHNYTDPRWLTYKQAEAQGWQVRKGEKGTLLERWIFEQEKHAKNPETGEMEKQIIRLDPPRCNAFYVFNAAQIDGIPPLQKPTLSPEELQNQYMQTADRMIRSSACPIIESGDDAYYSPSKDEIHLPPRENFLKAEGFLATMLHEMAHSTGHKDRLDRNLQNHFGTEGYAREELCAEISSMFLQNDCELPFTQERYQNNSNYLLSWIKILQDDPNELFRACRDADQASEYVMEHYHKEVELEKTLQKNNINSQNQMLSSVSDEKRICRELHKAGCTPNKRLVNDIWQLEKITGKQLDAARLNSLSATGSLEINTDQNVTKLTKNICNQMMELLLIR